MTTETYQQEPQDELPIFKQDSGGDLPIFNEPVKKKEPSPFDFQRSKTGSMDANLRRRGSGSEAPSISSPTIKTGFGKSTLDHDIDRQFDISLSNPDLFKPKDPTSLSNEYYNQRKQEFEQKRDITKSDIKSSPQSLSEYTKKRITELNQDIEVKKEELKGRDEARAYGAKLEDYDTDDALYSDIAATNLYKDKLKSSVVQEAAKTLTPQFILNGYSPRQLGREIVRVADPEMDAKYTEAEKNGQLPQIQTAQLEKLGLELARGFLQQQEQTPEVQQKLEQVKQDEADFDMNNFEVTAQMIKDKLGVYFYRKGKSGFWGYSDRNIEEAINDPRLGLSESEKKIALEYVLPTEKKLAFSTDIPGSGFFRSAKGAIERSLIGAGNTILSKIGQRGDPERAYDLLNAPIGESRFAAPGEGVVLQQAYADLVGKQNSGTITPDEIKKKEELGSLLKVRTKFDKIRDGMGDLTGQVIETIAITKGIGVAGRALTAIGGSGGLLTRGMTSSALGKVLTNNQVGLFVSGYLNSYDRYRKEALNLIPGDENADKREAYANTMSYVESATEGIFNDVKVLNAFTKSVAPTIKNLTTKLINKEITQRAAKEEFISALSKYIRPFGKEFFKAEYQNAIEEASVDWAQGMADAYFGGQPFDLIETGKKSLDTFVTTLINSPLVSAAAAHGAARKGKSENAFLKTSLVKMGTNPTEYLAAVEELQLNGEITEQEAAEKKEIITKAQQYVQELPQGIDAPAAATYVTQRLNEDILQEKIAGINDPVVAEPLQKQLERSREIRRGIFDGSIGVTTDLQEVTDDSKKAKELNILDSKKAEPEELIGTPFEKKVQVKEESENLLPILREKGGEFEKQEELQYFIDKAGEAPAQYYEKYGEETTNKLIDQVPTEKLKQNLDDLLNINPENPNVPILDKLIAKREANEAQENTQNNEPAEAAQPATETTPEIIGTTEEGGAIPPTEPPVETIEEGAEGEAPLLSGIRKALVSEEIIKGVDLERVGDKEMMALGRRIIDTGEVNPKALVEKIVADGSGVLTPAQVVAMITYKADIDNQVRDLYAESNRRRLQGEDQGTIGVEIKNLEREIDDFDVAAVITASQQSMAFRLRQYMLDQNYNVTTQIEKYKANNDGHIPPEIEEKFRELDRKLREVKEKIAAEQDKRGIEEAQAAVNNIKEDIERELRRSGKPMTEKELAQKVKEGVQSEISKIYEKLPAEKKRGVDKAIAAIQKLRKRIRGQNYSDVTGMVAIVDTGLATIENALKLGVAVADAIEAGINRIKELAATKGINDFKEDEFRKDMIEGFESEGVSTSKKKEITLNEDGSLKIPESILRDLVASGVTDINDLVDKIHEDAVKVKPDVTKREVRDYITDYGKKVNPKADDVQRQLNTAKRIGRLLSEIEDLQKKKGKEKNPSTKAKLSQKERELKKQVRALQKDAGIDTRRKLTDEEKLSAAKERVKDRIAELERKIKNKDFAKKSKLPQSKDDELVKLEAQKEKLQQEFDNEQYKLKLKNRNFWQKTEDVFKEIFSGVVRGLVASFDLSAGLVQGVFRIFVNPKRSLEAFGTMFKHLVSEKASEDYLAKLKASEVYPLMQASKLAIDDKSGHVSAKEGLFISNWVNLIWNNVIARVAGFGTKQGAELLRKLNPYAASQRAFDGYINAIRTSTFADMVTSLQDSGYNFESNPEVFQKAADWVNTSTGRGGLGKADPSSSWLNIFLFAPRKVVSEVKMWSPYALVYYTKMPPPVRKRALINLATFLGTFTAVNALLWAASKPDDDDEEAMKIWEDFWNPNSSNFLTHKVGNKRISIAGGAKSMIVFLSRFWSGKFVDQYGKETELGDRYGKQINTRFDLFTNFIAGKTSPVINVGIQKAQERKGLELDNAEVVKNLTVPIWMQDMKELYKEDHASVNTIATVLSIFGANVRVPDNRNSPFTDEDKKDPVFKYFLDKGMNLPNVVPASIEVPDKETKTMKNLTDFPEEKIKQYQEEHKENLKEELKDVKDKGYVYEDDYGNISKSRQKGYDKVLLDDLSEDQLAKILKSAQVQATAKTKKKLFPK